MLRIFFLVISLVVCGVVGSSAHASVRACQNLFEVRPLEVMRTSLIVDGERARAEGWTQEYQVKKVWPRVVAASRKNKLTKYEIVELQILLANQLLLLKGELRYEGARLLLSEWEYGPSWLPRVMRRSEHIVVHNSRVAALDALSGVDPVGAAKFFKAAFIKDRGISDETRLYVIRRMLRSVFYEWGRPQHAALEILPKDLQPLAFDVLRASAKIAYRIQKPQYEAVRRNNPSGGLVSETAALLDAFWGVQIRLRGTPYAGSAAESIGLLETLQRRTLWQ